MNQQQLEHLLQQYNQGICSDEEKALLETAYLQWNQDKQPDISHEDLQYDLLQNRRLTLAKVAATPAKMKLWPKIAAAAMLAMILFGAGLLYFNKSQHSQRLAEINQIQPGKNGATLTLANGKQILITDARAGNIAVQSGIRITKGADGQLIYEVTSNPGATTEYNTLSTNRGQQAKLRLPDGTLVFLNAASSLKYPASFAGQKTRETTLIGEGYFQVAKDKAHPFVVNTARQSVEVLGTHFNISAYPDEPATSTTLLEGSVNVQARAEPGSVSLLPSWSLRQETPETSSGQARQSHPAITLKPGQQSILNGSSFKLKEVDTQQAIAWQKGYFRFYDENIQIIMHKIARWYNVDVEYKGQIPTEGFNARITRYSKITDVLDILENTGAVHFNIEGRKIIVSK